LAIFNGRRIRASRLDRFPDKFWSTISPIEP
jgi:hypothetical protein